MKEKYILDACCGGRTFWFDKKHKHTLYIDIEPRPKGICKERPNFSCEPDVVMDFRSLDLPDNSFKHIVWDPPHLLKLQETSIMRKKYGCLHSETWQSDLKIGFKELWRVSGMNLAYLLKMYLNYFLKLLFMAIPQQNMVKLNGWFL